MNYGGDQEFESVTMPHVNALFQTALHLTENRVAAEDLVHEVYGCAWKSFGRAGQPTDWRLRLFKILIEQARRRAKPKLERPNSFLPDDVSAALARVPPPLKEMIVLIDCQEFSYDETAAVLDLSRDEIAQGVVLGRDYLMTAFENLSRELHGLRG